MSGCAERVRIAVIGDCPVFRHGISNLIGTAPDLHLVAAAPSIESADGSLRGAHVVLMDLQQSAPRLAATVTKLRRRGHSVLVVSSSPHLDAVRAIQAGASGYLSRQAEAHEMLTAIRTVGSGRSYVSAPAGHLMGPSPRFTDREQEILRLLANGSTDHEIAAALGISKHTVHSHLDRIGEKTGSRRRPDLTRIAVEQGLTGPE
ncbi:response regulator transcription factor [Streptomyces sp. NPDC005329]|uniref:response regulator transcription factor n=1 Tax=Streptomyces sp. NPDC005329 TaxID=3157034 RepID=UPI0033B3B171